jgi:hypothetical protein
VVRRSVVLTLSKSSNHKSRIGPTSARLALALISLVEHVSQDIVVAVPVDVMDAYVSVRYQVSFSNPCTRNIYTWNGRPTSVDCPGVDTCARVLDKKDKHSLGCCAPGRGESFRFFA